MISSMMMLGLFALGLGYIAIWMLAIRIVTRGRMMDFEWMINIVAAFGLPFMIADTFHSPENRWLVSFFLCGWISIPVVIDLAWAVSRLRHGINGRNMS